MRRHGEILCCTRFRANPSTLGLTADAIECLAAGLGSRRQLATENLFLRKQLALYVERQVKPRRAKDATRVALVVLSRVIGWRPLLTVVKPDTHSVASAGVPALVALEVTAVGPPANSARYATAHRGDGDGRIQRG